MILAEGNELAEGLTGGEAGERRNEKTRTIEKDRTGEMKLGCVDLRVRIRSTESVRFRRRRPGERRRKGCRFGRTTNRG